MNVKNWIRKNWTPQGGCQVRVCRMHDGKTLDLFVAKENKWEVIGQTVTKAAPTVIRGDVRSDREFQLVKEKAKLSTSIARYLLDFTEVAAEFKWTKPKLAPIEPGPGMVNVIISADKALEMLAADNLLPASETQAPATL